MKFSLFFFSTVLLGAHAVLVNEGRLLRGLQANKVDICHFDEEDSTWNTISVSANGNAVTAHKNHGDFICGENSLECNASLGCVCVDGYEFEGEDGCVDIDECSTDVDNCDANASCTNSIGSFDCECNDSYEGNGETCVHEDCLVEPENLGFESGDLSGWSVSTPSSTSVVCNDGEAKQGDCYMKIETTGTAPTTGLNEIKRNDLFIGCGDDSIVTFWYRFQTLEYYINYNDYLIVKVTDQEAVVLFEDTVDVIQVVGDSPGGDSGWLFESVQMGNIPIGTVVSVSIYLGVQNGVDGLVASFGFLDGVEIK